MLSFVCPQCGKTLKVPEEYLGMHGRCTGCGLHLALIGMNERGERPMTASIVEDAVKDVRSAPAATLKQMDCLRNLGASEEVIRGLNRRQASERIEQMKTLQRECEPPTPKQRTYLETLQVPREYLRQLRSKAGASRMIESVHSAPTAKQLRFLKQLGVDKKNRDVIMTRAAASSLINEMLVKKERDRKSR